MQPDKIKIISDSNELKFHSKTKTHNVYEYTKSKTKKENLIGWTDEEIKKLIANNIIKEI